MNNATLTVVMSKLIKLLTAESFLPGVLPALQMCATFCMVQTLGSNWRSRENLFVEVVLTFLLLVSLHEKAMKGTYV